MKKWAVYDVYNDIKKGELKKLERTFDTKEEAEKYRQKLSYEDSLKFQYIHMPNQYYKVEEIKE